MKKFLFLGMVTISISANAIVSGAIDAEANLVAAHAAGMHVYTSCILIPPVTKPQIIACDALNRTYEATLTAASAPLPLSPNMFPSPFSWSPYDICRYEPSILVFPVEGGTPICPSV